VGQESLFGDEVVRTSERRGPAEGMVRLRLVVAYNGKRFRGLAIQPDRPTVVGDLAAATKKILRLSALPEFAMSGRTDAGVHGFGQVLHVDVPSALLDAVGLERVHRSLLKMLSPEIVVRSIDAAPNAFHARFSATYRRYRYTILNRAVPDPFSAVTAWHIAEPLDVRAMRLGSDPFLGEHDFTSFCRSQKGRDDITNVRVVTHASWEVGNDGFLFFTIQASAFCQQMVRSIVGTLVSIGRGDHTAGDVLAMLHAKNRSVTPPIAPPHGLCLMEVGYPPDDALPPLRERADDLVATPPSDDDGDPPDC
jgi:tRNA pseudouridine38-40 synthase